MIKFLCNLPLVASKFTLPEPSKSGSFDALEGNFTEESRAVDDNQVAILLGDAWLEQKQLSAKSLLSICKNDVTTLSNINGHFVAIILDQTMQTVTAFSDKFSTFPLYYHTNDKQILLSTTLQPLVEKLADKPKVNPQSIYNYIYFHCIPSPDTIYESISKLGPARKLQWQAGCFSEQLYWTPNFTDSDSETESVQHEKLRTALNDSIKPLAALDNVGAFLSGGLDSSSVAGYLAKNSKSKAKTFTIGFSEPGYDETEFAQAVADHFGTDHYVYQLTPDDILNALPKIAEHYDEPFGNSSALPTYFCAKFAKEHGIETLLAGDGGDELFAGNERYASQKIFEKYFTLPGFAKSSLDAVIPILAKVCPTTLFKKAQSYIDQANQGLPKRLQHYNFLHQNTASTVFTDELLAKIDQTAPLKQLEGRYRELKKASTTDNMLYLDWKFTLADNDLVKVNNMTDFGRVGVRYPMLSKELLALSCQISAQRKLPGNKLRDFYKKSLTPILPDSTINKSKQGFGLPFGKWLAKHEGLMELADRTLEKLKQRNLIKPEFIDHARESHRNVHAHYYGELVWIMMMLELWLASHE